MSEHAAFVGTLTIPISTTDSNVIVNNQLAMARTLIFESAATAYTGTISLRALGTKDSTFANLLPVKKNATAVVLTAATRDEWDVGGVRSIAIKSSGAEAAARVVRVYAILRRD